MARLMVYPRSATPTPPIPRRARACASGRLLPSARAASALARARSPTPANSAMSRTPVRFRASPAASPPGPGLASPCAGPAPADCPREPEPRWQADQADPRLAGYRVPRGVPAPGGRRRARSGRPRRDGLRRPGRPLRRRVAARRAVLRDRDTLALPEGGTDPRPPPPQVNDRRGQAAPRRRRRRRLRVERGRRRRVPRCPRHPPLQGRPAPDLRRPARAVDRRGRRRQVRVAIGPGSTASPRRPAEGWRATLALDGWLYLAAGDDDSHVVGPDGSRVDLARTGGVFRCRPDGSRLRSLAMGLRDPSQGSGLRRPFDPFCSTATRRRLEAPGAPPGQPGSKKGTTAGGSAPAAQSARLRPRRRRRRRPGNSAAVARLGRGVARRPGRLRRLGLPESFRDVLIVPDPLRGRPGAQGRPRAGSHRLKGETTLLADDDQFRPVQVAVGADGALYVLDRRALAARPPGGEEGRAALPDRLGRRRSEPAPPPRPNHWERSSRRPTNSSSSSSSASTDHAEADGPSATARPGPGGPWSCAWAGPPMPRRSIPAARHPGGPAALVRPGRGDHGRPARRPRARRPPARRAGHGVGAEGGHPPARAQAPGPPRRRRRPGGPRGRPGIGRHAEPRPQQAAAACSAGSWPTPGPTPRSRMPSSVRLERLGDAGVEEVALAIRTRRGAERESAVACFSPCVRPRPPSSSKGWSRCPTCPPAERVALIRQFAGHPARRPVPTQGLADWVSEARRCRPAVKLAALEACRLRRQPGLVAGPGPARRRGRGGPPGRRPASPPDSRPPGAARDPGVGSARRDASAAERLAIVRGLGRPARRCSRTLDAVYLAADDAETRRAALRSMADADRDRAVPALEAALAGPDPTLRPWPPVLGESPRTAAPARQGVLRPGRAPRGTAGRPGALRRQEDAEDRKLLASIEDEAAAAARRDRPGRDPGEARTGGRPLGRARHLFPRVEPMLVLPQVESRGVIVGPPR